MPEPICADSCACPCIVETPQQWKPEIGSDSNGVLVKQIKRVPSAPHFSTLHTLSEQDLVLLKYGRRLVNGKHNQTLWSVSLWGRMESILYRAEFFIGNLQLLCNVQVLTALEHFHFIITLMLPSSKANQHPQQTMSPVQCGGFFQAVANSLFYLVKNTCQYKSQEQRGFYF